MVIMINLRKLDKQYIFHNVQVYANGETFTVRVMIDIETIYNFIAQDLIKEHNIPRDNKVLSLTAANGGKMCFFKHYYEAIEAYGQDSL